MLWLLPDGSAKTVIIGNDLEKGQEPQVIVPQGVWQGSRLVPGGHVALLGTTVAPGFDFADYEHGSRAELSERYPSQAREIENLTRP